MSQTDVSPLMVPSEEKYRDLYEHAPDMYVSINPHDACILECNHTLARVTGYTKEEIIGQPVFMLYHPHCVERIHTTILPQFQRTGEIHDAELQLRCKDGRVLDVSLHVTAVRDARGGIRYSRSILRDITRRKRAEDALKALNADLETRIAERTQALEDDIAERQKAEQALRRANAQLEAVFTALPDLFFLLDQDGVIQEYRAHKGLNDLYTAPEAFLGKTMQHVLPPAIGTQFRQAVDQAHATHNITCIDYHLDIAQERRFFEGRISPLPDGHTLVVVRNVTVLKQHELTLQQAKEVAESANEARRQVLAATVHDLRTPLNTILGYNEMLEESPLNNEQHEYVRCIAHAAQRQLTLLNDVLDFAKIDTGKFEVESYPFQFRTHLTKFLKSFAPLANERGIQLRHKTAAEIPETLIGDYHRLLQILSNLIGNALKFTETGHVQVRETLAAESSTHVHVRFEVLDTGHGIPAEECARIFLPFTQMQHDRHQGSGLGLAICQQLVTHMGGEIGVESTPGLGSTFWFVLPFGKEA